MYLFRNRTSNAQMRKRIANLGIKATVSSCLALSLGLCLLQASMAQNKDKTMAPLTLFKPSDSNPNTSELSLTVLRDSGLSLNQIRQQAINIFCEATRTTCSRSAKPETLYPTSISEKEISHAKDYYLEPRLEWLVYYVGTVEPVIKLFVEDMHDTKSGVTQLLVPEDTKQQMLALNDQWNTDLEGINKELSDITALLDSAKFDNAALAHHAVRMFKYTESLETSRQKAFIAIRDSEKRNAQETKVNLQ